jgi:hypothetical protein
VTVTASWVMAFKAAKTLKRLRPEGALTNKRSKHHKNPRKVPMTKWAASTKKGLAFLPWLPQCAVLAFLAYRPPLGLLWQGIRQP